MLSLVMSLLNNWLELRSDAYKITVHQRRPIPARTDTIGPWLDSLTFLTWLGALTNSALVYLFHPSVTTPYTHADHEPLTTSLRKEHPYTEEVVGQEVRTPRQLLLSAAMIALVASHGYFLVRWAVRHLVERMVWRGSREVQNATDADRTVKENYLRSLGVTSSVDSITQRGVPQVPGTSEKVNGLSAAGEAFWEEDEGLEEIRRASKDE
jgi:anoctamin-10